MKTNFHSLMLMFLEAEAVSPLSRAMAVIHRSSWLCSLENCKTKPAIHFRASSFKTSKCYNSSAESSSSNSSEEVGKPKTDRIKLAVDRAKDYRKSLQSREVRESTQKSNGKLDKVKSISAEVKNETIDPVECKNEDGWWLSKGGDGGEKVPYAVRIAMEKTGEYQKNKEMAGGTESTGTNEIFQGLMGGNKSGSGKPYLQDEDSEKDELKISSVDFMGLNFGEKKDIKRLPAGLVPAAEPFSEEDLPEVELLVGDASMFGDTAAMEPKTDLERSTDFYKPKVSTWGVFPRPGNISKTFGGGRNILPGEALETEEDRVVKQAHTRQLLTAYKSKIGLNIDPMLKTECEKALRDGDSLMDAGKLKDALPYYQKVMDKLVFQSELHGLAALQWSICLDSLSRPEEAQFMYEKLQSHPNAHVSKRARQFIFSFKAMDMMKVERSKSAKNTSYQKYFDVFVEENADRSLATSDAEGELGQALPYIAFLASPILIILLLSAKKGM